MFLLVIPRGKYEVFGISSYPRATTVWSLVQIFCTCNRHTYIRTSHHDPQDTATNNEFAKPEADSSYATETSRNLTSKITTIASTQQHEIRHVTYITWETRMIL